MNSESIVLCPNCNQFLTNQNLKNDRSQLNSLILPLQDLTNFTLLQNQQPQ